MGVIQITTGFIYRNGSRTVDRFTPRDKDTKAIGGKVAGLSAFDTEEAAFRLGGNKVQQIDVALLPPILGAFRDDSGHVSIVPIDASGTIDVAALEEWASFRGTGQTHSLTAFLLQAVVGAIHRT